MLSKKFEKLYILQKVILEYKDNICELNYKVDPVGLFKHEKNRKSLIEEMKQYKYLDSIKLEDVFKYYEMALMHDESIVFKNVSVNDF